MILFSEISIVGKGHELHFNDNEMVFSEIWPVENPERLYSDRLIEIKTPPVYCYFYDLYGNICFGQIEDDCSLRVVEHCNRLFVNYSG